MLLPVTFQWDPECLSLPSFIQIVKSHVSQSSLEQFNKQIRTTLTVWRPRKCGYNPPPLQHYFAM